MNILFIGPPGSGKGTQAKKLFSQSSSKHLSTGDLFRKHLKEQTELGKQAKSYIEEGKLVPDQVTNGMVEAFLNTVPEELGIVFDGFPRNIFQAEALDLILKKTNRKLDKIIFLEIPDEVVIERLTGRLWAEKSGQIYHITNNPPKISGICDQSGETLVTRKDDKEDIVISRLKIFHENNQHLIEYYDRRGIVERISAGYPAEEVFREISKVLNNKSKAQKSKKDYRLHC